MITTLNGINSYITERTVMTGTGSRYQSKNDAAKSFSLVFNQDWAVNMYWCFNFSPSKFHPQRHICFYGSKYIVLMHSTQPDDPIRHPECCMKCDVGCCGNIVAIPSRWYQSIHKWDDFGYENSRWMVVSSSKKQNGHRMSL